MLRRAYEQSPGRMTGLVDLVKRQFWLSTAIGRTSVHDPLLPLLFEEADIGDALQQLYFPRRFVGPVPS